MNSGSNGSHCGWTSRRRSSNKDSYWSYRPSLAIDKFFFEMSALRYHHQRSAHLLIVHKYKNFRLKYNQRGTRENGWSANWARRLEAEVPRIQSSKGESNGRDWKFEEARRGNQCPSSPPVMPQQVVVLWLLAGLRRCCVFILLYMSPDSWFGFMVPGTCFLTLFT